MKNENEDELVEDVLSGNHNSFELLLRPYRGGLLNIAYRMTGNIEDAKEICQEAFIKIFRHLHSYKKGTSFKSWIYKTVINASYDFLRKKKKFDTLVVNQKKVTFDESQTPEKLYSQKEIKEKIKHCIHDLSPREKAIFLLRDQEGYSISEASEIIGCSSVSVRVHLSRARKKIKEQFEKIYFISNEEVNG